MIVGAAVVELHVHDAQSLKAKRGVVRSIIRRVRNRFNLSVSEVGGQDTWQWAVIGLSAAGGDATSVRRVLDQAGAFIEELHLAEVCSIDVEVVEMPHLEGFADEDDSDDDDPGDASGTSEDRE
jgi:uncharacterized protein